MERVGRSTQRLTGRARPDLALSLLLVDWEAAFTPYFVASIVESRTVCPRDEPVANGPLSVGKRDRFVVEWDARGTEVFLEGEESPLPRALHPILDERRLIPNTCLVQMIFI